MAALENKKILFYIGNLVKGGAQRVVLNLAQMLTERGCEVAVLTPHTEEGEYEVPKGVRRVMTELVPEEEKGRIHNLFARIGKLRRLIKAEQPDLVVSFLGKNNFMAIVSTFGLHIPVLVSVRGTPAREYSGFVMRALSGLLFGCADGVVLQTPDAKAFFPARVAKKAVILPNPLNPAFLQPRYEGERENSIVTVGRIDANKDQNLLVDAFLEVADRFPDVKLVLYGDGEDRTKLIEKVKSAGMQQRILLPGAVTDVPEKIRKARIFVLPSKTEGMPNALMEAMALGLAVVSTDCPCGGPKMLIRQEENGLLVPVGDKRAMAEALDRILSDGELEERLGREAAKLQQTLAPEAVNEAWAKYLAGKLRQ